MKNRLLRSCLAALVFQHVAVAQPHADRDRLSVSPDFQARRLTDWRQADQVDEMVLILDFDSIECQDHIVDPQIGAIETFGHLPGNIGLDPLRTGHIDIDREVGPRLTGAAPQIWRPDIPRSPVYCGFSPRFRPPLMDAAGLPGYKSVINTDESQASRRRP